MGTSVFRRLLEWLVFFCFVTVFSAAYAAYPVKPIRLVVGYPPGGGSDLVARLIGNELTKSLSKQVVVDNRPGADGVVGAQLVARAAPDGYTLLLIPFNLALSPSVKRNLPYDALSDFEAISLIASAPMALAVNPKLPVRSVAELISLAKARSGGLNYGSSGIGGTSHVAAELFKSTAKIDLVNVIYRGSGPVLAATIAGEVQVSFGSLPPVLSHMKAGTLKVLAVTTRQRARAAPDLPTISESGLPGYEFSTWYGLGAPAKTPRAIRALLHAEVAKALVQNHIQASLLADGAEPIGSDPDAFQKFFASEVIKWKTILKNAGINPQ